jgi:hypothetical protein
MMDSCSILGHEWTDAIVPTHDMSKKTEDGKILCEDRPILLCGRQVQFCSKCGLMKVKLDE